VVTQLEQSLGAKIRAARSRMGFSQQRVADELGVHVVMVQRWEADKHVPQMQYRRKLWDLLELSPDDFPPPTPGRSRRSDLPVGAIPPAGIPQIDQREVRKTLRLLSDAGEEDLAREVEEWLAKNANDPFKTLAIVGLVVVVAYLITHADPQQSWTKSQLRQLIAA